MKPILIAALVLGVFASAAPAVTYTASGQFDDGTSISATLSFPAAAMSDLFVSVAEMDSFTLTTQTSPSLVFTGLTRGPDSGQPFTDGFGFAGPNPGDALTTQSLLLPDDPLNFFLTLDTNSITELFSVPLQQTSITRTGPALQFTFVPDTTAQRLPSPTSAAVLIPLVGGLTLSRRRNARVRGHLPPSVTFIR